MSSEGGKKKPSPFGDAKPREENIDPEHEERLSKKFEQIDAERTTLLTKPAPSNFFFFFLFTINYLFLIVVFLFIFFFR